MGWCTTTEIFDTVASALLEDNEVDKKNVLEIVISALEDGGWECQQDSEFYDHPVVQEIFRKLHPRWFEDEE